MIRRKTLTQRFVDEVGDESRRQHRPRDLLCRFNQVGMLERRDLCEDSGTSDAKGCISFLSLERLREMTSC
jgi:hypothetical protein